MASSSSTIVLITGANSGVGYAATKVIASSSPSYHIIMAGRSLQKVESALSTLQKDASLKGTLSTLVLDVTDESSIASAASKVASEFGRVDVLINNAGIASQDPNIKTQLSDTLLANSIGPVLVTEAFKSLVLKSQTTRTIIHVTSGLGSISRAVEDKRTMWTTYSMSKAALNMFVVLNMNELGKEGVKVFGLCPGLVRSNLRGTEEEKVSAGGRAEDPEISGKLILDVIEGRRDDGIGKVVKLGGIWDW